MNQYCVHFVLMTNRGEDSTIIHTWTDINNDYSSKEIAMRCAQTAVRALQVSSRNELHLCYSILLSDTEYEEEEEEEWDE